MKKKKHPEQKLDLKHDTMEFAASGDEELEERDVLDFEDDEDISAVELDFLDEDPEAAQAAALNEVEKDRMGDADYLPGGEEWTDDLVDNEEVEEDEEDED